MKLYYKSRKDTEAHPRSYWKKVANRLGKKIKVFKKLDTGLKCSDRPTIIQPDREPKL